MTLQEQIAKFKAMTLNDVCEAVIADLSHRKKVLSFRLACQYAEDIRDGKMDEIPSEAATSLAAALAHWSHPDAAMYRARLRQIGADFNA